MDVIVFFIGIGLLLSLVIAAISVIVNFRETVNFMLYVFNTHIKRKRVVDALFIEVHSKRNKLRYIKLENVYFSNTISHRLYPVFYFDTGTYIPYSKYYRSAESTKINATDVITKRLSVDANNLTFNDDGGDIYVYVN